MSHLLEYKNPEAEHGKREEQTNTHKQTSFIFILFSFFIVVIDLLLMLLVNALFSSINYLSLREGKDIKAAVGDF